MRIAILALAFLLSACVTQPQFSLPKEVAFQGKNYQQVTQNQLDEMQQSLFLLQNSRQDPDNWQQGILLFTDKNSQQKTLNERVVLRKNTFAKQAETRAEVAVIGNELRSQVLYPPTARFRDYQLEVSRGRDSECGYSQMQFSVKYALSEAKSANIAAYWRDLTQLAAQFMQLPWQIECR